MKLDGIKSLTVDTPQGVSGLLHKEARYAFNYASADTEKLASIALPFRHESYASGDLFSIFAMNRPEGYLLESLRNRFGKISPLDDMALLKITGKNQIGRLSYLDPEEDIPSNKTPIGLDEVLKSNASEELFHYLVDMYFDSGISGFQPKVLIKDGSTAVVERITTHTSNLIVKSSGHEYPHLAENEYLCMSVAKEAGLDVPDFWLSDDNGLFVLRRFDLDNSGHRWGLEDMCVLANKSATEKYHGSYEGIARIIALLCSNPTANLEKYFAYVATSVLVKNGDAHLKNFSLMYEHPGRDVSLSPLYDVVNTAVYVATSPTTGMNIRDRTMALNMFRSKEYPTLERLAEFGKSVCHVRNPQEIISNIMAAQSKVIHDNIGRINDRFLSEIADSWGIGLPFRVKTPKPHI